jgi:hypothetical protein
MSNEIMSSLIGTPFRWLREVIYAFSHGNLAAWKKLQVQFADALNQQVCILIFGHISTKDLMSYSFLMSFCISCFLNFSPLWWPTNNSWNKRLQF